MKPWNLNQIDIKDREAFKRLLIDILNEGRKLTPMEIAKVELFLQNNP